MRKICNVLLPALVVCAWAPTPLWADGGLNGMQVIIDGIVVMVVIALVVLWAVSLGVLVALLRTGSRFMRITAIVLGLLNMAPAYILYIIEVEWALWCFFPPLAYLIIVACAKNPKTQSDDVMELMQLIKSKAGGE